MDKDIKPGEEEVILKRARRYEIEGKIEECLKECNRLLENTKEEPYIYQALELMDIQKALTLSQKKKYVCLRKIYDKSIQKSDIDTDSKMEAFLNQQGQIFSYYFKIKALKEQIMKILEDNKKKGSKIQNLIIVGANRSGKTELAIKMFKILQGQSKIQESSVAIVKGSILNNLNLNQISEQLEGGALVIEKASGLEYDTIMWLNGLMKIENEKLFVIIEDEKSKMDHFLELYPGFERKFKTRIEMPVLTNKELVSFGQVYSEEKGYSIDEMGLLALYARIDRLQTIDHFVTLGEVKNILDKAMECTETVTVKHFFKEMLRKDKDLKNKIILSEREFEQ